MSNILIVYGTTEGHTRKIAERVADWVRARGNHVTLVDSTAVPTALDTDDFDAFILAGSIHQGKHQASLAHFVKDNVAALNKAPSALLSVSMSAVNHDEKHLSEAQECIDQFTSETGWSPTVTTPVAGALLYTKYDWLKRMIMKSIVRKEGGDIDTSKDYEYTDWVKLEEFVDGFVRNLTRVAVTA